MAKIDNIVQQIRNAQAAAIVKNGGITANNYSKVEADTKSTLQKQIAQQQSAKKESGQAETPALPEVKDTRTTQQKHDDAKKAYDDYVSSDEYKQRLAEANKTAMEETIRQMFPAPGVSASDALINAGQKIAVDSTEQELKATMEHYRQQMEAEENQRIMDSDLKELETWTDEERERLDDYMIYNSRTNPIMGIIAERKIAPMVAKYGKDKVNQMVESYTRHKNKADTEELQESAAASAGKNPLAATGHSLLSVGANLLGSVTGPLGFVEEITSPIRSGRYSTLDPNNAGYLPAAYTGAVRGQVTEDIKGDGNSWLRNLFALGYQGGMSALDSGARIVASGGSAGISSALAASNSFGNSIRQYSQQGASPEQAAAMAVVNSGLEYATEKLPTDEVLKLFKGGTTKDTVGKILTQAFLVEPTSEEVNLFASVAAETMILGEKSDMKQKVGELVANGMSYDDAQKQCYTELWKEAAETYAVSSFSGGLSATGAAVIGSAVNGDGSQEVAQEVEAEAPAATVADEGQQIVDAVAQELAQQAPPQEVQTVSAEAEQLNTAIAQTLGMQTEQQNQTVTGKMDFTGYVPQNVNDALVRLRETGSVPNSMVRQIMADPDAMRVLSYYTGFEKSLQIGKTQADVKRAIAVLDQKTDFEPYSKPVTVPTAEEGADFFLANRPELWENPTEQRPGFAQAVRTDQASIDKVMADANARAEYVKALIPNGLDDNIANAIGGMVENGTAKFSDVNAVARSPQSMTALRELTGQDFSGMNSRDRKAAIKSSLEQHYREEYLSELTGEDAQGTAFDKLRSVSGIENNQQAGYNNNKRNPRVQSVIDRLNSGAELPGIDEILSLPEIAAAEAANDGPETISLPNREGIREAGYQKAVQKGSWNGKDYAGPIKQERRMDIVIGLPGSGKSSVYTERLSQEHQSRVIDTDDFREYIPEYNGSNASIVHEEASRIRTMALDTALDNGDNILLSTIGANPKKLEAQIRGYREDGYSVYLHLNELPNEKSLARAIGRYVEENGQLGRYVSPKLIAQYGDMPTETYKHLIKQGVVNNEGLDANLPGGGRESGGRTLGNVGTPSGTPQSHQEPLLAGYDWYNNDVERGQPPRLIQSSAGIQGTGAAEADFSGKPAYNATLSEDNAQADRRGDVRPMELPQRDINGGNVSAVTGNVYGAGVTPDEFASLMEEPTARGDFSYVPISNNEATQQAMENISRYGWQDAYTQWSNAVHQGRAGAEMSARGALFLNHAAQAGDRQQWLNILSDFQRLGTNTAQGLQAFRILRNLAPSDRLYMMRRSVAQMVEDMHLNVPIEIDQQLADQYQNAQTNEEADAILDEIIDDVAAQIPSTVPDRWTALRYVNMLGNLRTQARNISGNIGAKFTYLAKDQIGAALEKVAHAFNPDFQRTKSAWVSNELKALGRVDFDEVRDIVLENGRFDDARRFDSTYFAREVNERRRIFRNGFMESYRRLTNWAMNNDYFGDAGFAKAAYARAFGGYLKANGFTGDTLEGINQNLLDDARLYAIQQAQESTFRDHNAVSDWVGRIGRRQDTPRAIRTLSEGVMPFRSTPANVLVRAEEFSPLGIINTAVTAARAANPNSEITGTDVVESMAKTLTGTGLFIMGAYLGKMGALAGGPDPDDEKAEFDQMNGYQNYALQLGDGKNITIDFLSPLAVPMFLGAEFEKIISDGGYDLADFETVFTSLADPLIQMSMLQGLNDTLDGIKYSENNLGQFFLNASMSYLTQGLTNTLMGQLERSNEENRMTTYIDKDSGTPQWLQRQLGKMSQKIPGWDYQQGEYLNAWGQTEKNEGGLLYNLLSPGYISTEHSDLVSRELYRLRETTGENVFPQTVEKTVSFTDTDGNHHAAYNLSQSELETMQKVEGQTAARLMAEVMTNGDYSGLTDKQKAQVVENIYSYAQEEARKQALPKYYSEASAWMRELGDDAANGLIRRATLTTINSSVTNTVDNIENGWEVTPAAKQDLDSLYDAYAGMSKEAKKQILDDAISDTAKFLEIRSRGVSTEQYLDVVADIKALKPEPTYTNIRDIQTREAIAENDSLSTKEKDYVMKAYMTDYDPTAKSPQTTELKYDAIRKLGISPEGYTEAYRMYLDASGSGKRRRTIAAYVREFGYDYSVARKLYDIYAGYWKPWTE